MGTKLPVDVVCISPDCWVLLSLLLQLSKQLLIDFDGIFVNHRILFVMGQHGFAKHDSYIDGPPICLPLVSDNAIHFLFRTLYSTSMHNLLDFSEFAAAYVDYFFELHILCMDAECFRLNLRDQICQISQFRTGCKNHIL